MTPRRPAPLRPHAEPLGSRHARRTRGDGIDCDYQTNARPHHVRDAASSRSTSTSAARGTSSRPGPTNASPYDVYGGQPYNTCNLSNVNEWVALRRAPHEPRAPAAQARARRRRRQRRSLHGLPHAVPRRRRPAQTPLTTDHADTATDNNGLERRGAWAFIPDLWVQVLWQEVPLRGRGRDDLRRDRAARRPARQRATTRSTSASAASRRRPSSARSRTSSDLQFGFGWASGDPWVDGLDPGSTGLQPSSTADGPISTFRFHPDYHVDLIFFRNILSRVEGAYYFRPSVDYDFIRNPNGQKFGGGAALIWSRASEFVQTPGPQARPRRRARPPALLPVEGRLAERRPDEDRRLLHDAPVRRLLPARRPRLPARQTSTRRSPRLGPVRGADGSLFLGVVY